MLVNSPAVTVNNYTNTSEILESLIILPLIVTDDVTAMCIRSCSLTDTGVLVGVELVAAAAATLVRARSIDARLLTPALVPLIAFVDIYIHVAHMNLAAYRIVHTFSMQNIPLKRPNLIEVHIHVIQCISSTYLAIF